MSNSLNDEYARILASLSGDEFQIEVSVMLGRVILGFQVVPAKPQGDAGLDGVSHNGERAYCCYGLEHNAFGTNRGREAAIVKKFSADLRRLFELETNRKRALVYRENGGLARILPKGQRIKHIKLIVNWFESNRVIGPIQTNLVEYKMASQCRFVDSDVAVVIVGPKQLANEYPVDEITIARVQQHAFITKVEKSAEAVAIKDPKDFDWKMQVLEEIRPDQVQGIRALSVQLRSHWRTALAFERELGDALPSLHHALERARGQIVTRVVQLMITSSEPWMQLPGATQVTEEMLGRDFGRLYDPLIPSVSSGEVARLIGECTIGWKKAAPNA